jgi:transcriptional regulator with XRE-family HTH domain
VSLHEELSGGLTLQELADRVGVTQSTLSTFENEKRNLKPEPMGKLMDALKEAVDRAIEEGEVKRQMTVEERRFIGSSSLYPVMLSAPHLILGQ